MKDPKKYFAKLGTPENTDLKASWFKHLRLAAKKRTGLVVASNESVAGTRDEGRLREKMAEYLSPENEDPEVFRFREIYPMDITKKEVFEFSLEARPPFPKTVFEYWFQAKPVICYLDYQEDSDTLYLLVMKYQEQALVVVGDLEICYPEYLKSNPTCGWSEDLGGTFTIDPDAVDTISGTAGSVSTFLMTVGLLGAMRCKNIARKKIYRTKKSKKHAKEYDSYWVLDMSGGGDSSGSGVDQSNSRSPRTHYRRGHVRRLGNGAVVWVRSSIVNPDAIGTVEKDYYL